MCECMTLAGKAYGILWKSSSDKGREKNYVCVSGALQLAAALLCVHSKGKKKKGMKSEVNSSLEKSVRLEKISKIIKSSLSMVPFVCAAKPKKELNPPPVNASSIISCVLGNLFLLQTDCAFGAFSSEFG